MTTILTPSPKQKFFTNNGAPANKYKLFVYQAGTTTKTTTWTDSTGGTPNTNPIILDYRGECNLWISPNVSYKYVLAPDTDTDPPTNPIWTVDNLVNSQLITLYGGVDTGSANAYVLNFTANFTAYTDGIIINWIPSHSSNPALTSTINVNGIGAVALINPDGTGSPLIIANVITQIMYKGGSFYLTTFSSVTGQFTGTLTGMTAATTGTVKYIIANNICTLYLPNIIVGTSNTVAMTMTGLPTIVLPGAGSGVSRSAICVLENNTANAYAKATVVPGTATITFSTLTTSGAFITDGGAFTAAGNKGIDNTWQMSYPLT